MILRQAQDERVLAQDERVPAQRPVRRRAFVVPRGDIAWCAALAEALSVCCSGPSERRVGEVRALIAAPPEQMLQADWRTLVDLASAWLTAGDTWVARGLPRPVFAPVRAVEAALRDKVLPVPRWAERYP